ncbi:MAG TPA: aspartate-semialdehyde dehydrogenase [Bacillota bacterium]|nr:aspartate-semialdehyde dehydrogenase [Bacillota bacterium]
MAAQRIRVGVVGATGLVGGELLRVLEQRSFPLAELRVFASGRSAGNAIRFRGDDLPLEEATPGVFADLDLAFFCAGADVAETLAPLAAARGCVVIDKSSAFRRDPGIPLAVPEVNPQVLKGCPRIVASPNCSTIQLVVAISPLHRAAGLRRVVVSTYQSVSGTGREAVTELKEQARAVLAGGEVCPDVYPHPIAFNLFPQIEEFGADGYSREEVKLIEETRRILELPDLRITATTARVPVFVGHCAAVNVELERRMSRAEAVQCLRAGPGIIVLDQDYPTPLMVEGRDEVFVGRVREDPSQDRGLDLWVAADNLRKGAATNAVQIAEFLQREG